MAPKSYFGAVSFQAEERISETLQSLGLERTSSLLLVPDEAPRAEECAREAQLSGQPNKSTKTKRTEPSVNTSMTPKKADASVSEGVRLRKRSKHGSVGMGPVPIFPSSLRAQPLSSASFARVHPQTADQSVAPAKFPSGRGIQGPGELSKAAEVTVGRTLSPAESGRWRKTCDESRTLRESDMSLEGAHPTMTVLGDENRGTADDVADGEHARNHEHPRARFIHEVCALANERPGRKARAVRRIQSDCRLNRVAFDARAAIALLDAVERAARPCLFWDAAMGRFAIKRGGDGCEGVNLGAWHEVVVREVGYVSKWADLAPKSDAQNTGELIVTPSYAIEDSFFQKLVVNANELT